MRMTSYRFDSGCEATMRARPPGGSGRRRGRGKSTPIRSSLTAVRVVAFFLERQGAAALMSQPETPGTRLPPNGVRRV
jgi:hypothetical protein